MAANTTYSELNSLLSKITTRLNYIKNNSTNDFVLNKVSLIETKMTDFKDHSFTTAPTVEYAVRYIIDIDITRMKGVPGESAMVVKKMGELEEFVSQIPDVYFKADPEA